MTALIEYIKQKPELFAAIIALVGVVIAAVISALVSLTISKRSSYITAVTAERSKWIDKLRENIAELLGTCGAIHLALPDINSPEAYARREKADRLIALITMQLNPGNEIDKNMIDLLPGLPAKAERADSGYRTLETTFVRHAQFLLKEEWEKVKTEAMGAILSFFRCRSRQRQKREDDYRSFCKTTGKRA